MSLPQKIQLSPNVICQELADEAVLLNLSNEQYYGLNEVGMRFWQLLESGQTVTTAMAALEAEYAVERAQLESDLAALVTHLQAEGLVMVVA